MRKLLVLWDPRNPLVPAAPVVEALRKRSDFILNELTFREIGHPTLPNEAFDLPFDQANDGLLWIEGGPLPKNLKQLRCRKVCWLVNTALEPTLLDEVGNSFEVILSTSLRDTVDEKALWLPLAAESSGPPAVPAGLSILVDDPRPPHHLDVEHLLQAEVGRFGALSTPVVVALGNGRQPHPMLFDCLRSGVAVLTDPDIDFRGLAHVGEHLDVYPSREGLAPFLHQLLKDPERLQRLAARGPAIIRHLHEPDLRAARIVEAIWPTAQILSGREHRPRVSILVTCHRYLRRLRVCLESLARQDLPAGALEIVVADPASPDGLADDLVQFAERYPGLRVVRVPLDARYHRNRGFGIHRAFEASMAPVVIGIDGDLVFPPDLIRHLEQRVLSDPGRVYGIRRSFVEKDDTERILRGEVDPFAEFDRLSRSPGDGEEKAYVGVLGYCQAVDRKAFARARYPEEFDLVNQSDIVFLERLEREAGVRAQYLEDRVALHLWHPRNWMGTSESL